MDAAGELSLGFLTILGILTAIESGILSLLYSQINWTRSGKFLLKSLIGSLGIAIIVSGFICALTANKSMQLTNITILSYDVGIIYYFPVIIMAGAGSITAAIAIVKL